MIEARKILRSIEGAKGSLSRQIMKHCDDCAIDVFGHHNFEALLCVYSARYYSP